MSQIGIAAFIEMVSVVVQEQEHSFAAKRSATPEWLHQSKTSVSGPVDISDLLDAYLSLF
ncbi:hypothetical protein [uncultured Paraglaciecola sp.]|uniref:hypothetical protein n=1 Tax=uncultured Paraglaciecola sp. TaxID=1765024 RepID=UPI0030D9B8E6